MAISAPPEACFSSITWPEIAGFFPTHRRMDLRLARFFGADLHHPACQMAVTAMIVVTAHKRASPRMADIRSPTPFANDFDLPELRALEKTERCRADARELTDAIGRTNAHGRRFAKSIFELDIMHNDVTPPPWLSRRPIHSPFHLASAERSRRRSVYSGRQHKVRSARAPHARAWR